MIRAIEISNYQSLKRVRIRMGRLTVVTGPSNTGKSALIRALELLAFNARGTSYVTHGQKTCSVSMSGTDDEDTAWMVDIQRGSGDSYHVIDGGLLADDKTYTKLAGKVPEDVTRVLRLSEVNFAGQFDRPYLLDATGAEAARVLGKLTNVTLLYKAAQEANRRRLASASLLKAREADLAVLEQQKAAFVTLPAERDAVEVAERSMDILRWQLRPKRERLGLLTSAMARALATQDMLADQVLPELPSLARLEDLAARRVRLWFLVGQLDDLNARRRSKVAEETLATVHAEDVQQDLNAYTAQWGVCPACGQPVRKKQAHEH